MSTLATTNIKHPSSASNNVVLDSSGNATLATAKITTLADSAGANTSTPAEIASGRAKAWVNFNGQGTVAIRASYNVSSITDNGTGDYTVNFTTAMSDANYATVGLVQTRGTGVIANPLGITVSDDNVPTTSAVRVRALYYNATAYDYPAINVAVFR